MLAATVAVWGIQQMLTRNAQLIVANDENRRLAVSEERNRFARDLHDILGHSLTVITVKAELAQRLLDVDPARAKAEVADLERLSRDALSDVRRAVEGYRELTLPGELARARTALAAAEIDADLPNSTEEVPSDRRELFAWTVREGVTNVIRHSGARRCTVRLTPDAAEVLDDGRGPEGGAGRWQRAARAPGTRRCPRRHRRHAGGRAVGLRAPGPRSVTTPRWTIRLLLADDQALVRGALTALLNLEPDLEVVSEVGTGDAVVAAVLEHRPDVALLDVEMPGLDGISATAAVRAAAPETKVLIVTTFGRPGYLRRALQAGASGFVVKDTPGQPARGRRPPDPPGPARRRPGARHRQPARGRVAADRPRERRAPGRSRRLLGRRDREEAVPLRGHRAQPPVRRDRQDQRGQPGRGGAGRGRQRLAVAGGH